MSCVLVIIQTKLIFIFTVRINEPRLPQNCFSKTVHRNHFTWGEKQKSNTKYLSFIIRTGLCSSDSGGLLPWPYPYPYMYPCQQQPPLRPQVQLRWWCLYPAKGSRQSRSGHYIRVRSTHRHQSPRRPQWQLRPQPSSVHCGRGPPEFV